jgi:hypothetical protein
MSVFYARPQNCEKRLLVSLSVRLSVSPYGTTRLTLDNFHEIWCLRIFSKNRREDSIFIKLWPEEGILDMNTYENYWYLAELSLEWEMLPTRFVGKKPTWCLVTFSPKSCRLWDNVEKYYYGWSWFETRSEICSSETQGKLHSEELSIYLGLPAIRILLCLQYIGTVGGCGLQGCWY